MYNWLLAFSNVSIQFRVDTRNGLFGLRVVGHVVEELKFVIVHAPTRNLQTEEENAANWDELKIYVNATHIRAQVYDLHYLEIH